jgi:fumarylacetoacetase
MIDETHDPSVESWVDSANDPNTDFPIQNLPFGVFRRPGSGFVPRIGVAIGDRVLDLAGCYDAGLLDDASPSAQACRAPRLNELMSTGRVAATSLRRALSHLLRADAGSKQRDAARAVLMPMSECELTLPADIGDYTDFYASVHHATNVGSMFRPDNPLLPNYKWVPIGYHGRASSIVVSGEGIRRPLGQTRDGNDGPPTFGASKRVDYELEVGAFIGAGNALGSPIAIDDAEQHVFGLCLVNDWSARDIQAWEYQPLGPFLAKNFGTSISPWIVTLDALEPFRATPSVRPEGDPQPLPYLAATNGGFDISLEVFLTTAKMRGDSIAPWRVSSGSFTDMYWTFSQLVTHHASNGCNLRPGDLLASGTVSGIAKESRGCLLERTWRGSEPLALPSGETRAFLHDDDEVIIRGSCTRSGYRRIGFGVCTGRVLPAPPSHP